MVWSIFGVHIPDIFASKILTDPILWSRTHPCALRKHSCWFCSTDWGHSLSCAYCDYFCPYTDSKKSRLHLMSSLRSAWGNVSQQRLRRKIIAQIIPHSLCLIFIIFIGDFSEEHHSGLSVVVYGTWQKHCCYCVLITKPRNEDMM